MIRKHLVFCLIFCCLPTVTGSRASRLLLPQGSLHPRQTPIIVAPPGSRTSPASQPTSLNYWWPYGPNGVNPTATTAPLSPSVATEVEETETMEDTSTDIRSTTSPTTLPSTFSSSVPVTLSTTMSTRAEETTTDSPSKETDSAGPTTSGDDAFRIVNLLPLFIILGVLVSATLIGWAYGRCMRRCRRDGEPTPGGPDIGGKPYEGSGYDYDTTGPLHSLGVSWVDASRINSRHNLSSGVYYTIPESKDRKPGTPSKNKPDKRGSQNWFRHTLSRRKHAINSPSGEKGLNAPLVYPMSNHRLPIVASDAQKFGSDPCLSPVSSTRSPKTLRIVNTSPATGPSLLSPVTSSQPTPFLSSSRHASLRRKIANKVKESGNDGFTTTPTLEGAFESVNHKGHQEASLYSEDWALFKGDPHTGLPGRRYTSPDADSGSSLWSPDPEMHRERMQRLRVAAEASRCSSPISDLRMSPSMNPTHPLPPAPAVLLSPPLQPHLFFTRTNSEDSERDDVREDAISMLNFTNRGPGRNSSGHPNQPDFDEDDSFGPRVPLGPTNRRARNEKARTRRDLESTETLPLSPELRGAAMTKLDEIVKSHWSIRNLAELPRSPTLYGALNATPSYYSKLEDEPHQAGIEEMLLAGPELAHTQVE